MGTLENISDRSLLLMAVAFCFLAAWFTIGYHHPDEHFQIWEFANYKLGRIPASDLPWEFPEKMRPGLQPFMAYGTVVLAQKIGIGNPFVHIFLCRLLCGLAVIWVYWNWCSWLEKDFKRPETARWLRLGLLFFWFMPYLGVRFSSENVSAICFFGGLLLLLRQSEHEVNKFSWRYLAAGFLIGTSFFFRYQIAFAGVGLIAWLLFRKKPGAIIWGGLVLGVLPAIALGTAADRWLYGEWVCPPYHYFVTNVLHNDNRFGTEPWWWYFSQTAIALIPPLSIVLLAFFGMGLRRKPGHVLSWCFLPFFAAHWMVGHKEMRFLFPMLLPFFFLCMHGWEFFRERLEVKNWMSSLFRICIWANAVLLVGWMFLPAKEMIAYSKFLWDWHEKHPDAKVFFVKKEPRPHYPLNTPFYEAPGQAQISWYTEPGFQNDTSALRPGDLMFFTGRIQPPPAPPPGYRLERIFAFYPEWFLHYNVNNWQNRTYIWGIYALRQQ